MRTGGLLMAIVAVLGLACFAVATASRAAAPEQEIAPADAFVLPTLTTGAGSALFIGDSFTLGPTARPELGYACLAASALDMNCTLATEAGTGYINGGPDHRLPATPASPASTSMFERIAGLRARMAADVVVFDAGRNDFDYDRASFQTLLGFTLERAVEAWPTARIFVLPPWGMLDPGNAEHQDEVDRIGTAQIRDGIAANPRLTNVVVLDTPPLDVRSRKDPSDSDGHDGVHPTLAQHRRIAEWLSNELRPIGAE